MSQSSFSSSTEGAPVAKRQRLCFRWESFPRELRISILQFASIQDLATFAMVSRQSREDCRDESLPQMRVAVIACDNSSSFLDVLSMIEQWECFDVFGRFGGLKLVNHAGLSRVNTNQVRFIIRRLKLTNKTFLDLSLPPGVLGGRKKDRQVAACVPKNLAKIMPNLREVDLSYVDVTQSALSDLARHCPNLEKIRWDYCNESSAFASGQDLKNCRNLRELYMDNATFYVPVDRYRFYIFQSDSSQHEQSLFMESSDSFCVLWFCKQNLERVSLKKATYFVYGKKKDVKPFTQLGLMKFVRGAENLRWFRSDLNDESIAILQEERPEITFVR